MMVKTEAALDAYQKAEHTNPDYCFPEQDRRDSYLKCCYICT